MSSIDKKDKLENKDLEIYPSFNYRKVYDIAGNDVTDLTRKNNYSFLNIIQDFAGNDISLLFSDHEIINN